jgi:ornithine cyclodeaminase/alanine dehydrogenase-like protein (mu-crystallin family)
MPERIGIEVVAAATGEACVRDADVVTTITSANEPVLMGSWLADGTHINAVGATTPDRRELDDDAVARCGTIVVELKEAAIDEVGELIHAVAHHRLDWDHVRELHEVVSGRLHGRRDAAEITLSDTIGVGAEDVALAWFAVNKARERNVGIELDFEPPYNLGTRG